MDATCGYRLAWCATGGQTQEYLKTRMYTYCECIVTLSTFWIFGYLESKTVMSYEA